MAGIPLVRTDRRTSRDGVVAHERRDQSYGQLAEPLSRKWPVVVTSWLFQNPRFHKRDTTGEVCSEMTCER